MNGIIPYIQKATGRIKMEYFSVARKDAETIYRERVYCYELYHQLRNIMGEGNTFLLHGELDKAGHKVFDKTDMKRSKPDLLFHIPGSDNSNKGVVEVKSCSPGARTKKFEQDVIQLANFVNHGYCKAVFLVYGGSEKQLNQKIDKLRELVGWNYINLLWHREPLREAELIKAGST